jgi:hypothetical protein
VRPWTSFLARLDRLSGLKAILLSATLLGMLACLALWLNSRDYPLLPVAPFFPVLASPWDRWFLCSVLLSLVVAFKWYRPAVLFFLGATLFLYLGDQNRGQPWIYMYWLMLGLTLLPEATALAACRIVFSAVYVFSGIHKCNANYFHVIPDWFVSPATTWGLPTGVIQFFRMAVASAPVTEILIGLMLWAKQWRWFALSAAVLLHGAALLFLGPVGHKYNGLVLPWNLAMVALAFTLFGMSEPVSLSSSISALRQSKLAVTTVILVWLLPILNFFGWWDSYFSFSLYSMRQATADIYVSEGLKNQLPARLSRFVREVRPAYDPAYQAPYLFDYTSWSMAELGAPGLTEPRAYRSVFHYLNGYATSPNELHMILMPCWGPVLFCRGEDVRPLMPKAP